MTGQLAVRALAAVVIIVVVVLFVRGLYAWALITLALFLAVVVGLLIFSRRHTATGDNSSTTDEIVFSPYIVLVSEDGSVREQIRVDRPEFTIGRDPQYCDYVFPRSQTDVSRIHAKIHYDSRQKQSYLVDEGSRNGTYINGKRLQDKQWYSINNHDSLQIGTLRFSVQYSHY